MRTKFHGILTLFMAFVVQLTFAQEKTISGTVTDAQSGMPLPGVNIIVKGTTNGVLSDFDGNYTLDGVETGQTIAFSYLGYAEKSVVVGDQSTINVAMKAQASALDQVVITALGIAREKKSLGYATQEVSGEDISNTPSANFVNSLSGQVAGLNISSSGTLGGSSNVVIRGSSSLTGNNQALFVINGVPISNANTNTSAQKIGGGGYDYGNAAADINPNNIKSINVLKGAAATALYGARAANGVIIIETKKGAKGQGIGISISSSVTWATVNDETLPVYQDKYGAGYGPLYTPGNPYFTDYDFNGDGNVDLLTPYTQDASYGAPFDSNLMVYQWPSIYPLLDSYGKPTPWVAGAHTPNDIWETGITYNNSFAIDGGTEKSSFRLAVSNLITEGVLPNSKIKRNNISFSSNHDFSDKLTASTYLNYTKTDGKGRPGTGYDSQNIMQQFRQWWQLNVDLYKLRDAYFATGKNITWNPNGINNLSPIYSDNPYFSLYENYETDTRNRYYGNFALDYEFNDWLSLMGRFTFDTYSELREERVNKGSSDVAMYSRFNNRVSEYNYDFILTFNKDLSEDLNLNGNIGLNLRRNEQNLVRATTNGGLVQEGLFSLNNSADLLQAPYEYAYKKMTDGIYARVSLGYLNTYYVEGTVRRDRSSTLPKDNNTFVYPSISGSVLLSNLIDAEWVNLLKLRANYAEVGNAPGPYNVFNSYSFNTPFGDAALVTNRSQLNNSDLKPERTKSYEFGFNSDLFNNRVSLNVTYYNARTYDQITPVPISTSTGYSTQVLNAGTIENQGVELFLNITPFKTKDFRWDLTANWAKNKNKVIELAGGIQNLQLADLQATTINAVPGQPYGTIRGKDYVYKNGKRVIGADGYYKLSSSNSIIGNINPDWTGGIKNTFQYKNLTFSFLIDIQKGGDVFSLDTWYGYGTGLYPNSAGLNDLGNPKRLPIAQGGGIILPGVTANGQPNTKRIEMYRVSLNPYGWQKSPEAAHVYDASFVKLREVSLTYAFGEKLLAKTFLSDASISLIGKNLWIINKNIPYADPEAGLSSGNIQGFQSGAYPSSREVGVSLNLKF